MISRTLLLLSTYYHRPSEHALKVAGFVLVVSDNDIVTLFGNIYIYLYIVWAYNYIHMYDATHL